MNLRILILPLAFILDLILGDPHVIPHPVSLIGKLIELTENLVRTMLRVAIPFEQKKGETSQKEEDNDKNFQKRETVGGIVEVILVCLVCCVIPIILLRLVYHLSFWAGFVLEIFWCWQLLAIRSLRIESMKVYDALYEEDLEKARSAVSMIVGRDTDYLDEAGVAKAAVETVAESTTDGIIAPMLYMAVGGVPMMFLYKCVNTMDSMLGYKNNRYLNFGYCAAKLDDVANFIPARLAGLIMVGSSFLFGFNGKNAWKIFKRDRRKHASPNSAHTEAAMAGALEIQLAGPAYYFGELYNKPKIGDPLRAVKKEDIPKANRLMYGTSIVGLIFCVLFYFLLHLI